MFTKGPLEISPIVKLQDGREVRYVQKDSNLLAQFWTTACDRSDSNEVDWTEQERDANAQLYAAAPEMYEALKALVALWRSDRPFTDADAQADIGAATEKAEAALARAEGRRS